VRIIPDSLFGRLMAALLAVIGVTAVIIVVLVVRERQDIAFRRGATGEIVDLIATTSMELARLPRDARETELRRLHTEPLSVERGPSWRPPPPQEDPEQARRVFRERLGRELGDQYLIEVALAPIGASDANDVIRVAPDRFGPVRPRSPGEPSLEPPTGPARASPSGERGSLREFLPRRELDVSVVLPDGEQVKYRTAVPLAQPPLPTGIFFQLFVLTVALAAVLFAMTRTITRPLLDLACAAEAVGRGARLPPLPETGAREVREATHAFNAMQERLRRYLDSRTQVLAAMSHDLRTPLTRLRLRVETLDDDAMRERCIADLEDMNSMVVGALNVFRHLNDDEAASPIDIASLLEQLRTEFAEVGADVAVTVRVREPLVAKPRALKRCLTNLVSNAVTYGGSAAILAEDDRWGREVVLRVLDDGPGIPEEALEQIFEPFFRLEKSRNPDTGGVGLGLSIARDIAQAHGGSLVLRNRESGGAEAVLRLPRAGGSAQPRP